MSLADLLAKNMGSKLEISSFDTQKEDRKNKNKEENLILPKNEHRLVFLYEKRNGKPVTIIGRFQLEENEKKEVLKLLKSKLACGGAIKDEYIELQGDLKDKAKVILENNSWKFKNR
ncbi:translation initiation factor [Arcobacter porcinus]|uniref:eIF1/SUI1 family translation initiation factor n=1 Tax=Arcobacter porcinus TaxID=1935204 RepID=A0A5C2HBX3_9BACT|nr:translation initiation factor [Arcobacter porcinus]OCL84602.1 translation initiation factor Sui1 [Arcobacter porcinus]OCL97165.1 translation initiation factor Sui1 [Aliarcobacter thereius]QEP39835.1 eIF1/SUI1 family translation initiation factor [Arcobacter porcinus]